MIRGKAQQETLQFLHSTPQQSHLWTSRHSLTRGNSKNTSFLQSREVFRYNITYTVLYFTSTSKMNLVSLPCLQPTRKALWSLDNFFDLWAPGAHWWINTLSTYCFCLPCFHGTFYLMIFWKYSVLRNFSPTSCLRTDTLLWKLNNTRYFLLSWHDISVLHPGTLHFQGAWNKKSKFLDFLTLKTLFYFLKKINCFMIKKKMDIIRLGTIFVVFNLH